MRRHVNIYGNVQSSIMHFLGCELLLKGLLQGRIFSGWAHDLDIGTVKLNLFFNPQLGKNIKYRA